MKVSLLAFLIFWQSWAMASTVYPIQIGLGAEACHPNSDGLKTCGGISPQFKDINIRLDIAPEGDFSYGQQNLYGKYLDIGYSASVKITRFERQKIDDIITLQVTTWNLKSPNQKHTVVSEAFANSPQNLNRIYLRGYDIGDEDYFSTIILGVRSSKRALVK